MCLNCFLILVLVGAIPFGQTHRWIPLSSVHLLQSDMGLHAFLQGPREV